MQFIPNSSLAGQRLLWGTFSIVSLVCVLCTSVCVFKNIQWYEVDLDIPGSMRPFSHNETERIAMRTIWSVQSITIEMDYPVSLNKTIPISQLSNASMIGAIFNVPASSLFLLQDLQKTSEFFFRLSQVSVGLSILPFFLTFVIYLRYCLAKDEARLSAVATPLPYSFSNINEYYSPVLVATERPRAVTLFPNGTALGTYTNSAVWISQKKLSMVILVTSVVVFMTEFLGACFYAITLKLDSQSLLPTLARGLKFLCMTHSTQACHVDIQWKIGILVFVSVAVIQFTQAIIIQLIAYEDKEVQLPLPGSALQPLLVSP